MPVLLFALILLQPDTSGGTAEELLVAYFVYGAIVGFFGVPALILAGAVIAFAGESWARTERGRSRLDALTIAIADGLIVLGLPLAVTAAYLQGGGPLFC